MSARHQLDADQRREVRARLRERLAVRPEVRFAYVHGSFTGSGTFGDIDVAVSIDPGTLRATDTITYELTVQAALERGLGVPVEVRVLEDATLSFQYAATRGDLLFVKDAAALAAFRERTWSAYLDFAPLREEVLRDLAGRLVRNAP